jgi:putative ATP-dependent endonuclease of the OLD family
MLIEAYLDGNPALKGINNTDGANTEGIFLKVLFDPDLAAAYAAFIGGPVRAATLPIEFYKIEWYSFAWDRMTHHNKCINSLFVDPSRLHPTYGRSRYINTIINAAVEPSARSKLNLHYRQMKVRFNTEPEVVSINKKIDAGNDITDKELKIVADDGPTSNWENDLQLSVDDITFSLIGKGEQNQIQIKIAISNKAKDMDVVMLEEPENHLSHMNLVRLISYIENRNQGKQIFLSTHSSYVLNKLSIDKLCLLSKGYTRLQNIDAGTVKTLKRLPGYDTLRVVLAQKLVLVEGPSDELLLKKYHLNQHGCLPEEKGIDIIVVRGIGFKTYLDVAKPIQHPVHVVKDNDGDYQNNIVESSKEYKDCAFIEYFSPTDNVLYSMEPALIGANSETVQKLDKLAKVMLSKQTYAIYEKQTDLAARKEYLLNWYREPENSGSKKVDSAMKIFESAENISYPEYLIKALEFVA